MRQKCGISRPKCVRYPTHLKGRWQDGDECCDARPSEVSRRGAALRRNWRALLVCAAMARPLAGRGGEPGPGGRPRQRPGDATPRPSVAQARLQAKAAEMSATSIRPTSPPKARSRSTPRCRSSGATIRRHRRSASPCQRRRPRPFARMPDRRHLLRGGDRAGRRPARGRAGRAQPGPPPGLSKHGLRCRLRRPSPFDGLPVQLHLQRRARRAPMPAYWERSRAVAQAALNGYVYAPVGLALNYHANYVVPNWSATLVKIGSRRPAHLLSLARRLGRPAAFTDAMRAPSPCSPGAVASASRSGRKLRPQSRSAARSKRRPRRKRRSWAATPLPMPASTASSARSCAATSRCSASAPMR